jgi:hypothetical protein
LESIQTQTSNKGKAKMFIQISELKVDELPIPVKKTTLYSWAKKKIYPDMFKRICGKVLVDREKLIKLLEDGDNE